MTKEKKHDSNAVPRADGNFIVNHDNGQLKMKGRFVKDKLQGEVMTWYVNGKIKRKDEYVLDSLTNGHCYTATGQDTTWYPFYTGFNYGNDIKELYKFVGKNIKYPKEARKKWIEGEVRIQFIIEKDGTLTNEKIIRSVNDQIDQEGLRVLRAAPARWKPALLDGEPYRGHGVLPIVFRIEP
ncbi:hypothetical protein A4H97_14540 [Niastella yeongjuensis]|uniref:TonB C-terminal domain-containing protein n=1 Tax=Niastella yeongjuensis TaxID=354355 RepID=A0A1V9E4I0_9BACT|nr:energy transducer TonB [Niastella yeongjuensis]OQP40825.1 hypothetical protein A4H97_14540 [Niastella yeongjuensis]SEP00472.1 TonB family C-terminal domain-containing protein [Niastella yeongjuensis]